MATMANTNSKGMYSWWWNSHITPKNSKWLKENLTDMDTKVSQMIKLIEEDADSFARRAEMYYKKRPELMKLVEEFYRAYRALAERYDHATVVLRQAQRSMAEAFPNQVPMMFPDDSQSGFGTDSDPRTPEMPPPMRALFEPDELQKEAVGLSSHGGMKFGAFTGDSDVLTSRKGLRQLNNLFSSGEAKNSLKFVEGRARKGLNFHDMDERGQNSPDDGSADLKARLSSESERVGKAESEILSLKKALARLEDEKAAGLLQYHQSLERLSDLEKETARAQGDSRDLTERAIKAEAEIQTLKDALTQLEAEREASLVQYQQSMEKICKLENDISHALKDSEELNERSSNAETEALVLKQDLARVEAEKEAALLQYQQSLETISNLEEKLRHAEEIARRITERAEKAESEIETLKQAISKLNEEKDAAAVQYNQCLEKIFSLEQKIASAEEHALRLNMEIDDGVAKLKDSEERCRLMESSNQSLHAELESMMLKMGTQSEDLAEKQKELGMLWTSVQEERLRFEEAETAFQTLQHLHSRSQEELRSLALALQNRSQILKDIEAHKQDLENELLNVKDENKSLNELNLSSSMTIEKLQDESLSLRETVQKLEAEVELRVDQRNALQQEIYCLKEEVNDLNKRHQAMIGEVESVGLKPDSFGSSVKELQDENAMLKEASDKHREEKLALLEKMEILKDLIEKNAVLENSLADLNAELEGMRGKAKSLEESCHTLLEEKSTLATEKDAVISQLHSANEALEELSEKNKFLENSLSDANAELEGLRVNLKSLEHSCMLLGDEKSNLIMEREGLVSELDVSQKMMKDSENRYMELEEKYLTLEKEIESKHFEVEELHNSLAASKQEQTSFAQLSGTRLAAMEVQIHSLQEENDCKKKLFEEELDKTVSAEMEIFILQRCIEDQEDKNFSLSRECREHLEACKLSEKRISELELENCEKQVKMKTVLDQIRTLRMSIFQVLKTLGVDASDDGEDNTERDNMYHSNILCRLAEMQNSLVKALEENQRSVVENTVLISLLGQLKLDAENLEAEKNSIHQELRVQSEQFTSLQCRAQELLTVNEELSSKVIAGGQREVVLGTEMEDLHGKLSDLQRVYQDLLDENLKVLDDKKSLTKEVFDLCEEKRSLEEENSFLFSELLYQSSIAHVFKHIMIENFEEVKKLSDDLGKLSCLNCGLEENVRVIESKLEDTQKENSLLKDSLQNLENELISVKSVCEQLNLQVASGEELLFQKENALLEAEQMLRVSQDERMGLQKIVEDLKKKYEEVSMTRENQENQIMKLSEDLDHQRKETKNLGETNQELDAELLKLREELEKTKHAEDVLSGELQKGRSEIELWETQACALFCELQISVVHESLLEGKLFELNKKCEDLEIRSTSKAIEAEQMLRDSQDERMELQKIAKDLKKKYEDVSMTRENQENQIMKLSEDLVYQRKETENLEETNQRLDADLLKLQEELEKTKHAEDILSSELQKGRNEIELWETQACALIGELQISVVHEALLEGKLFELNKRCEDLEISSTSKAMEVDELKEKISTLEGENGGLKAQVAAYVPAVDSLRDSINSLEKSILVHAKHPAGDNQEVKDANVSHEDLSVSDGFNDIQNMEVRIKSIEKTLMEMEQLAMLEKLDADSRLEDARRQIEDLKSVNHSDRASAPPTHKPTSEITEEKDLAMTKDIMLDQVSESSSYGVSRRGTSEVDDNKMLELWESDFKLDKVQRGVTTPIKKHEGRNLSSESLVKEVGVDKTAEPPQEGSKKKILERLDSDVQKLTNLQTTVLDLKKTVETAEKSKKGKGLELDTLKGQLEEAEEDIKKLFDVNRKLVSHAEDGSLAFNASFSFDRKSMSEFDGTKSRRRRTVSQQAQSVSEKIGRLQLEVQKLQFLLLKFDEKQSRGKTKPTESKTRVLLRDYLYGGRKTSSTQKKKKSPFCSCVQPPTKGD